MADQENKPQEKAPAEAGHKSGPELEAEAIAAADAKPEEEKEAAADARIREKVAEARAGALEKGEALSSEKVSEKAALQPEPAKPEPAKPAAEKPAAGKPAAEKPVGEKPAAAAKPPAAAKPAGEKPAAAGAEGAAKKPAARALPTMSTVEIKGDPLIDALKAKFGAAILEAVEISGQQVVRVAKERAHDILVYLRDEATPEFNMLTDLTATHTPGKEKPFEIIYQTYALKERRRLRVKTALADGEPIETASDVWSTANWLEREAYDMFGLRFANHPDLRRILLPQGWTGHPLRKEYPLEYEDNEWVAQNLRIRELPEDWDYTGKFE